MVPAVAKNEKISDTGFAWCLRGYKGFLMFREGRQDNWGRKKRDEGKNKANVNQSE